MVMYAGGEMGRPTACLETPDGMAPTGIQSKVPEPEADPDPQVNGGCIPIRIGRIPTWTLLQPPVVRSGARTALPLPR